MLCPTCNKEFARAETLFPPFCSERCKLIDLGRWLDGDFAIPGDAASPEDMAAELSRENKPEPREKS